MKHGILINVSVIKTVLWQTSISQNKLLTCLIKKIKVGATLEIIGKRTQGIVRTKQNRFAFKYANQLENLFKVDKF